MNWMQLHNYLDVVQKLADTLREAEIALRPIDRQIYLRYDEEKETAEVITYDDAIGGVSLTGENLHKIHTIAGTQDDVVDRVVQTPVDLTELVDSLKSHADLDKIIMDKYGLKSPDRIEACMYCETIRARPELMAHVAELHKQFLDEDVDFKDWAQEILLDSSDELWLEDYVMRFRVSYTVCHTARVYSQTEAEQLAKSMAERDKDMLTAEALKGQPSISYEVDFQDFV